MPYVIDESSYRIDKTNFPTSEEAERRAGEAARMLGRAINVYELLAGELHWAFRVLPDGSVEESNPLEPEQSGEVVEEGMPVLGELEVLDQVAEVLEQKGKLGLAAAVDQARAKLATKPAAVPPKGVAAIAAVVKGQ